VTDLDAWLEDYKPYISSTKVCGRADLIAEHQRLDRALLEAQSASADMLASTEVAEAKRAVRDIEAEIEASQREFTFQGIGNKPWQDLKRAHPPSEAQRREGLDTDIEAFAPALIAAASLDPKVSPAQAQKMMDRFPPGEFGKLYESALEANGQVAGPPKSVTAALIEAFRQNGGSSTSAAPEESPDLSSWDDNDDLSTGTSPTKKDGS